MSDLFSISLPYLDMSDAYVFIDRQLNEIYSKHPEYELPLSSKDVKLRQLIDLEGNIL